MSLTQTQVIESLQTLQDPQTGEALSLGKGLSVRVTPEGRVAVSVVLGYPARSLHAPLKTQIEQRLAAAGAHEADVTVTSAVSAHSVQRGLQLLPGVKNIIAVSSGKGGVGKSTTAVNLALALVAEGARVGMLDADIYGPSLPLMLGLQGAKPESDDGKTMKPLRAHGLQLNSIGFLVEQDQAMIWRGPMATSALDQLLRQTQWDDLDYLVVDMPPGTGDIQLTLSQKVPVTGAVVVTTPQDIALLDATKGLKMFEKVGVPILGIVENMSVYCCPNCGHSAPIFGAEGGQKMAAKHGVSLLAQMPLSLQIREQADSGTPTVAADPDGELAGLYKAMARQVAVAVAKQAKDYSSKFPTITISANT
jgi:ATP-binding protein involved in chromosome partitioning